MSEETKVTNETLDNLNDAIKSDIAGENKPDKYLNIAGVYKYNNVNYTRPLRTDELGNLRIAKMTSSETQEITNPTLTNLNKTIKKDAINVNVKNLSNLNITDEFGEKQNLSAFQTVSKGASLLEGDASTFPKLLVHNVRPETTPVVNETDKNNDIIPLQCNVDNTILEGQIIKPLQSTIRALPASEADESDVKDNPNNEIRNEIMADLDHENALQTVDQNLKTVLGTGNYRLDVDGSTDTTMPLPALIGERILEHSGHFRIWYWKSNHYLISSTHINEFESAGGAVGATVRDPGYNGPRSSNTVNYDIYDIDGLYSWWHVMAKANTPLVNPVNLASETTEVIWKGEPLYSHIKIPLLRDVREHHYIIDNTNHKDVRIFGNFVLSYSSNEEGTDKQFFIMGSNDNHHYYKIYIIEESQTIFRTDGYDVLGGLQSQNDFDILIRNAPKYLKFKNSENGRTINSARIYYSQYT